MKSAKYVEDNLGLLKFREKYLKEHQDRIKKIMKSNSKSNILKKTDFDRDAIIENKMKIHQIMSQQRESSINKENSILFNKLVGISKSNQIGAFHDTSMRSKRNVSQSPISSLPQLRTHTESGPSLNFVSRKQEQKRIDRENLKLAEKLIKEESSLK